jgi:lysozyme
MINDLNRSIKYLDDIFHSDKVDLNDARQNALIDMMYNLGPSRFIGFKKMIAAIYDEDFNAASNEMLDSKWAKQVGRRAFRLARIMRTGVM